MSPATASRRRLIRSLIDRRVVTSQQELVGLLEAAGHRVTQATVSRDLDAVGAVKVKPPEGEARYAIPPGKPDDEARRNLARALAEFAESIAASGNLVVVKTPPGAAHLVGSGIDGAAIEGVVGTVAGDDTVLVVATERIGGTRIARELEHIGAGR